MCSSDLKKMIRKAWPDISLRNISNLPTQTKAGDIVPIRVAVDLQKLSANDIKVECLVGKATHDNDFVLHNEYFFDSKGQNDKNETIFELNLSTDLSGLQYFKIRMYPYNELLSHRFEIGFMKWL